MKPAAVGLVFTPCRRHILLVKRRDFPLWVPPGGGIEADETAEEAVRREIGEETQLSVRITRHIGVYLPINRLSSTSHLFECELLGEFPARYRETAECRDMRLFPVDQLPELFCLHQEWIQVALAQLNSPILAKTQCITYATGIGILLKHPILCFRYFCSRFGLPINSPFPVQSQLPTEFEAKRETRRDV